MLFILPVCDVLAAVLANLAVIAERRINMLMDSRLSGLPMFLVLDGGLNSGFMMAHVSEAALASEAKIHAMPVSHFVLPRTALTPKPKSYRML